MNQILTPRAAKERTRNLSDNLAARLNPFVPANDTKSATVRRKGPSPRELNQYREALLTLGTRLKGNVARADHSLGNSVSTTTAAPDSVDIATEAAEQDVAVSLLGSATETLGQVDSALERIEDGSYGRCAECNAPIPAARLEAIPYATCCVHCAARQEQAAAPAGSPRHFDYQDDGDDLADDEDAGADSSGSASGNGDQLTPDLRRR